MDDTQDVAEINGYSSSAVILVSLHQVLLRNSPISNFNDEESMLVSFKKIHSTPIKESQNRKGMVNNSSAISLQMSIPMKMKSLVKVASWN